MWGLWVAANAAEVDEATVLSGFSVTWERRPHRIKVFGIEAEGAELEATTDIQGGSWADGERAFDTPEAEVDLVGIRGRPVVVGSVGLRVEGRNAVRSGRRELGAASTTLTVDGVDDDVAMWITGFRFATDVDHPDGFTFHTMSVTFGTPTIHAGTARVPLKVTFAGGAVPDRRQALSTYGANVEVSWVAVPCAADEVQRETVESAVHLAPIAAGRHRDADRVESDLAWTLGTPAVLAALSGFRIDIHDGLFDGRYVRSLLVRVAPTADPLRSQVALGFDNAGPLARAVRVEVQADVTALSVGATDEVWSRSYTSGLERTTETGPRRKRE